LAASRSFHQADIVMLLNAQGVETLRPSSFNPVHVHLLSHEFN